MERSLRGIGTTLIVVGLVGAVVVSITDNGRAWRGLAVAGLLVLIGIGIRIEAAIRDRH